MENRRMASIARQVLILLVLGALGFAGWELWGAAATSGSESARRERPAPGVVVAPVSLDRIERSVSAIGKAEPLRSIDLAPSADGRVVEIAVSGGETVRAGDPIILLDDATEQAAVAEARAELSRASSAFDRSSSLQAQGRVAQTAYESAETALAIAEAGLARATKALEDRTLRAPFDGVIGFLAVDLGALVDQGDAIATLDDISALDVDFAVPERFFGEARVGAPVRAITEIYPGESFDGEVTGIDRRIDTVSRSFMARARIPNRGLRLPAGAFMRVTLVLEARDGVVAPEEAVVSEAGARYVYVVEDGRARRRAVTLGQRLPGRVAVTDGLEPGELVITRGLQKARDGAPVNILETEPGAPQAPQS
jgi:membrane fusion protein (multidrug efflux system)